MDRLLSHVNVEIRVKTVVVLEKWPRGTRDLPKTSDEVFPNIISGLLCAEEVEKCHGTRSKVRFSLYITLALSVYEG